MTAAVTESSPSSTAINAGQRTLAREATLAGVGFFSGRDVSVRLVPAEPNHGLRFVRRDLPGAPEVPVSVRCRVPEPRRTVLQLGVARIEMTEHVLAALAGMGVDNCRIEVNGPELPGLDGSALPYVEALAAGGLEWQGSSRNSLTVAETVEVAERDAIAALHPGPAGRLTVAYNLDYGAETGIGRQSLHYVHSPERFAADIAPARTFVRQREVAWLLAQGIGKRTSPRDLLVFRDDGSLLDNELRFPDECVRHKILDLIGDLALVGRPIHGHVQAHRSGHATNAALAAALLDREEAVQRRRTPLLDAALAGDEGLDAAA